MKTKLEQAAELERKAKALRREEKAFWDEILERKEEVVQRLNISDRWRDICLTYGTCTETEQEALYRHIVSDRQVEYYTKHIHTPADSAAS